MQLEEGQEVGKCDNCKSEGKADANFRAEVLMETKAQKMINTVIYRSVLERYNPIKNIKQDKTKDEVETILTELLTEKELVVEGDVESKGESEDDSEVVYIVTLKIIDRDPLEG